MDHSAQGPEGDPDGTAREGRRPAAASGMLALALVPVLAAGAFAGITLARATSGPPAEPERVAGTSAAVYPVPPYPVVGNPTATPPASSPAPIASTSPTAPGGGGTDPGVGPGGGGSGGGGSGGGGTGGGGSGGGGTGGGGGGGSGGGGGQTTTQPPPPRPRITSFSCDAIVRRFTCVVAYEAPGAVQVRWTRSNASVPAWDDLTSVGGNCPPLAFIEVTVMVSNPTGPASGQASFECPEPPCPRICPIDDRTAWSYAATAPTDRPRASPRSR
jgi:hypothetical protein